MKLIEGEIYLCEDGNIRRLEKIEDEFLHYSMAIGSHETGFDFLKVSKTYRKSVEFEFANGEILVPKGE